VVGDSWASPFSFFLPAVRNKSYNAAMPPNKANITGCRLFTPFGAIAPTIKGKIAPPDPPNAAANLTLPTCRCFGMSFVTNTIAVGKRGLRKNPRNATETEETLRDGTSQKMSSRKLLIAM
jgi:hypothetical protein